MASDADAEVEVAIVGGGPAGAVLAERLARAGHRVIVIERGLHDGPPRGETLHAGAWAVLDHLAITHDVLAAGARRVHRSQLRWASADVELRDHEPPQLAVIRPAFDRALLDGARRAGARIVQPAVATARERDGNGWTIHVEPVGPNDDIAAIPRRIRARVLADASGRASWTRPARAATTARAFALRGWWQWRTDAATVWDDARVEALADGWLWGAPAGDGYAAIALVDAGAPLTAEHYLACIAGSALLGDLPTHATLVRAPDVCDATGHAPLAASEPGLFRVGDAGASLDPLSSAGLHAALGSAVHASCAIHTLLRVPDREPLVHAFYRDARRAEVDRHQRWAAQHYAASRWRDHAFWRRRVTSDAPPPSRPLVDFDPASTHVALAAGVSLRELPCIVDGMIEARLGVVCAAPARSLVWLDDTAIAPLLAPLVPHPLPPADLLAGWHTVPPARRRRVLGALLDTGIVRPVLPR